MNADDPLATPPSSADANRKDGLLPLIKRWWDVLRRGQRIGAAAWRKQPPAGEQGQSDFRALEALDEAAAAVNENSHAGKRLPVGDQETSDPQPALTETSDAAARREPSDAGVGDNFGKYEIRGILGRGGQATTFKAWDPDAQRTVVIKAYHGAAPAWVDAVLEEGRKLAKVRSPNVVQCYHVERLPALHCLILEYVPGQTLAQLHQTAPLGVSSSLSLIAQVAEGLAAVHARGLLHRDIKPSNIVVGHDGVPKLLDFGLARSIGDPAASDPTGTFAYMAPEQAGGEVDRVDPRTDIFGLGATLYFLLTGRAPYEGTPEEIMRAAREGNVVPPRQRNPKIPANVNRLCLRCLAKAPEQRFESAQELSRALRRRPSRRFRRLTAAVAVLLIAVVTAAAFLRNGADDSRSLGAATPLPPVRIESVQITQIVRNAAGVHEPWGVVGRDSYLLRFGDGVQLRAKLSQPAYCYWLSFSPDGEMDVCFPNDADQPPPLTDSPVYPSADRPNVVYGLNDALGLQGFVLVVSETPLPSYNAWRKARPACPWPPAGQFAPTAIRRHNGEWEEAAPLVPDQFTPRGKDEPVRGVTSVLDGLVAWVHGDGQPSLIIDAWAIPVLQREASEPRAAQTNPTPSVPPYERKLEGEDARKASDLARRMHEAQQADRYGEAIQFSEELLALRMRVQGDDHWETIGATWGLDALRRTAALPAEQRRSWREAVAAFHKAQQHLQGGEGAQGKAAQAEPALRDYARRCSEIFGPNHPETAAAWHELAVSLNKRALYGQAETAFRSSLEAFLGSYGEAHRETSVCCSSLAKNLNAQGRSFEALPLYRKALDLDLALLGERDPGTATSYNNLAHTLKAQGRYAEAQQHYERALEIKRDVLGDEDLSTIIGYNNLGANLNDQDKHADAQVLFEKALILCHVVLGEKDADTVWTYSNLATCLNAQGKYVEAQPICQKALDLSLEVLEPQHPDMAWAYLNLAVSLTGQQLYSEARPHFQSALDLRRRSLGEKHPDTAATYHDLAINLAAQGKYDEARPHEQKALDLFRELLGDKHPKTVLAFRSLARGLAALGEYAEAAAQLRQAAAAYEVARLNVSARGIDRAAFGEDRSPYVLLAALLARLDSPAAAWSAAETNLARGLADELARRRGAALTADERARQAELNRQLSELQPRILQLVSRASLDEEEKDELANLQSQRAATEARLAELAVTLSQRELAPLDVVQSVLSDDAALVLWVDETAPGGRLHEHWGCVVRRTGEPAWEPLRGTGPESAWTQEDSTLPSRLRATLASGRATVEEVRVLVEALRNQRLAPLAAHLEGVQTLHVVAVNAMAGIPFELLAEEYAVSYVPSGAFLAKLQHGEGPSAVRSLLAVGDPVFQRPSERPKASTDMPPGGLLVSWVVPGGAADQAKLRRGDVLVAYGDVQLASIESLTEAMQTYADAQEVSVSVWREGEEKPFTRSLPAGRLGVGLSREEAREAIANRRRSETMVLALRGGEWQELPGSRVELAQLEELFGPNATSLVGSTASEQALDELRRRGDLSKFRYLHFATHGEANDARAMESALILAQDTLPGDPLPRAREPLLDGRLLANEVLTYWDLDAELVTLSACETALGRSGGGDGFLGFAQAFLAAGSRAVCLSLWKVDDTATALLMTRFYQNLLGKRSGLDRPMPKAAALGEAKQWLRQLSADEARALTVAATQGVVRGDRGKDMEVKLALPSVDSLASPAKVNPFSHPRYWSAFILIGDPN